MNIQYAAIILMALLWPLSLYCAFRVGRKRGIDLGWLDRYFAQINHERQCRDRLGRFCKCKEQSK